MLWVPSQNGLLTEAPQRQSEKAGGNLQVFADSVSLAGPSSLRADTTAGGNAGRIDVDATRENLEIIPRVCRGGAEAGEIGALPQRSRFHWLVSPRSTIIQMSPVHTGRTADPEKALERLLETMVR